MKDSLATLISSNQSAFVPGRRITDNILLTQELMHNYHLDRGPPRCAFKVDIQKAYETVDWGCLHKGKRGLRQGDPISPYLFTLVMEVLTLMLRRKVSDSDSFTYHHHCSNLNIINLCFADDLFLFAHGDVNFAWVIMEALDEFKYASGLVPSLPKSTAYFCNVLNYVKLDILNVLPFEEGKLPVKYLGVPLVSSRLIYRDCKELVENVKSKINDWKNKFLSFAGRVQLVQSVLASMHIYWAFIQSSFQRDLSKAWDIIVHDVIKAVQEFFVNGSLLKELNHTLIALILKVAFPLKINDYRPISCCIILFKCISKIISNRMKDSLATLISSNQSAFVPGRRITDNILLTQEIMHNYHLDRGPPRCAFKVDIQKAHDTVDWGFLHEVLIGFGFHPRMIGWIMECVTSTSFSISINGSLHGYFKGKRGLRQGDPISPYLFTLVMEVLTLMLRRKVSDSDSFTYHHHCSDLNIINLCFADDLFLFAHGDVNSARVIMEALDEFKYASGLVPSLPKSTAYFCNVLNYVKLDILNVLPFEEGKLPVKYLGVPLVSTRLIYRDCKELVENVKSKINDWKNKFLSFAGRVQLVQSVLASMHIYWASVFIIPSRTLLDLEQLMPEDSRQTEAMGCSSRNQKRSKDQVIEVIKSTVRLKLLSCKFKKTKKRCLAFDCKVFGRGYVFGSVRRVECLASAILFFPSPGFFLGRFFKKAVSNGVLYS
ncbi:putative reverse transcriptase domain, reverse transcriptase zinc-binding domain protein [Tanacetum coccineum]